MGTRILDDHDEPLDSSYILSLREWSGLGGLHIEEKWIYENGKYTVHFAEGIAQYTEQGQLDEARLIRIKTFIENELASIGSYEAEVDDYTCSVSYIWDGKRHEIINSHELFEETRKLLGIKVDPGKLRVL